MPDHKILNLVAIPIAPYLEDTGTGAALPRRVETPSYASATNDPDPSSIIVGGKKHLAAYLDGDDYYVVMNTLDGIPKPFDRQNRGVAYAIWFRVKDYGHGGNVDYEPYNRPSIGGFGTFEKNQRPGNWLFAAIGTESEGRCLHIRLDGTSIPTNELITPGDNVNALCVDYDADNERLEIWLNGRRIRSVGKFGYNTSRAEFILGRFINGNEGTSAIPWNGVNFRGDILRAIVWDHALTELVGGKPAGEHYSDPTIIP